MNTPKDAKVDYHELLNVSFEDISAKIRSGELVVPKGNELRDNLATFSELAPGSEERKALAKQWSGDPEPAPQPDPQPQPQPAKEPIAKEPEPKPAAEPVTPAPTPSPAPAPEPQAKPWWQEEGYASETEAAAAFKTLRGAIAEGRGDVERLQRQVDERNAQDGKLGRELKEATDKLAKLEGQAPTGEPAPTAALAQKPRRPNPTDPKYEDGVMDDKYQADLVSFQDAHDKWVGSILAQNQTMATELGQVKGQVDQVVEDTAATRKVTAQQEGHRQTGVFWDGVRAFQKQFGLPTSRDVREMNANAKDAAYWAALPATDRAAWEKIRQAANLWVDQDVYRTTGVLKPRAGFEGKDGIEAVLVNAGVKNQYSNPTPTPLTPAEEKAAREAKQQQDAIAASVPSAQSLNGGDDGPAQDMSDAKAMERLEVLNAERSRSPFAFQKDEAKFAEYNQLVARLGQKLGLKLKARTPVKPRR